MTEFPEDANILWRELGNAGRAFSEARRRFLRECDRSARIAVLKNAASIPSGERAFLRIVAEDLPLDEQLELICPLLQLVVEINIYSYPRPEEILLALPHELVLPRMRECVESMKQKQDNDELESLMAFLPLFDQELALETAYSLIEHEKPIIREIGEEYVRELKRDV